MRNPAYDSRTALTNVPEYRSVDFEWPDDIEVYVDRNLHISGSGGTGKQSSSLRWRQSQAHNVSHYSGDAREYYPVINPVTREYGSELLQRIDFPLALILTHPVLRSSQDSTEVRPSENLLR
jgi:hypothetical protein